MDHYEAQTSAAEAAALAERWPESVELFAEVSDAGRSDFRLHYGYGTALLNCFRYKDGLDQMRKALRYDPDSIDALNNLVYAHLNLFEARAAEETCRLILAKHPDHHASWNNLGLALNLQGLVLEGIEALQRAVEIAPEDATARDNLLHNLNFIATDGLDLCEVHRMLCADLPSPPKRARPDPSGRRLRVGYVSSDFRSHSVSFFMAGVIGTHDRDAFEVFCYSSTHAPDGRTESFRRMAEHFVDISTLSDEEAARRIEADQVDILVDLGGHTFRNRLGVFSLRPAPVQVSYLGYPATTGCAFMDYRLVDALTDPEGTEAYATEQLVRLPAPFLSYYPHTSCPEVGPLPALANGYITFGSFNHSSKLSDETLDLWSRVLAVVPDSRLFIKASAFSDPVICELFRERFASRGIDPTRLTFSGLIESPMNHLAAYGKVDLALDTFPYNGTTTTCEALWMGVPVISLIGDLHAARVGYTLLHAVGLEGMATGSPDEFVSLAAAFTEDRAQLASLRGKLQKVMRHSPLCDRFRLTRGLEDAYRKMLVP